MKSRKGRSKQHAFIYVSGQARDSLCSVRNCGKQQSHHCKLCNRSLCATCYKLEKVEDVFVVSKGEHKICAECHSEYQMMNNLYSQYNLQFNTVSKFNLQLWLKNYNQTKSELSKEYNNLKKREMHPCVEMDIENCHFNSSYHQLLIKTSEGQCFIDIKIAVKQVVNAFLHLDNKITYKKEIVHQAFFLLNFTEEIGAFAIMKFLYQHIIPQQLYADDKEFIRNLSSRILSSLTLILKDNLEQIPIVKQLLQDRLSEWILSIFSFNFRFLISVHTLQQTFLYYSFESIVNSVIAIITIIYPYLKGVNYALDRDKINGFLFSDIFFSQFKKSVVSASSPEDYYKLYKNTTNWNNEVWGNDYQQTLAFYEQQNKLLKLEITNLTLECKECQHNIEEIEKRVLDCEFESVVIPFEDDSNSKQKMDFLKQEQEELINKIKQKKEAVNNLQKTDELIQEQKEKLRSQIALMEVEIDEQAMEVKFIQEEKELNRILEELENEKREKKEVIDVISSELKQVNITLELMKQQE